MFMISLLMPQVVAYQKKLQQLDGKQQELVKDNFELKDLCLYLDEERNNQTITDSEEASNIMPQESSNGDTLSCPQCGYGPIWVVSRSGETNDVNITLVKEDTEATTKRKAKKVSGNYDIFIHILLVYY